jgi:hypothetical protein
VSGEYSRLRDGSDRRSLGMEITPVVKIPARAASAAPSSALSSSDIAALFFVVKNAACVSFRYHQRVSPPLAYCLQLISGPRCPRGPVISMNQSIEYQLPGWV